MATRMVQALVTWSRSTGQDETEKMRTYHVLFLL